jgi:hypothetical protein
VRGWALAGNAHDVGAVLVHVGNDAVVTPPLAVRHPGGDGVVRGRDAARGYRGEGPRPVPDRHLDVVGSSPGVDTP